MQRMTSKKICNATLVEDKNTLKIHIEENAKMQAFVFLVMLLLSTDFAKYFW